MAVQAASWGRARGDHIGLVTFGFGLLNVPGIFMSIFIGLLLILVIAMPMILKVRSSKAKESGAF
jgi:rhamnose transport system permease protein